MGIKKKHVPGCGCCGAGVPGGVCCTGTKPATITVEITGISSSTSSCGFGSIDCSDLNGTVVLTLTANTCQWFAFQIISSRTFAHTIRFFESGGSTWIRYQVYDVLTGDMLVDAGIAYPGTCCSMVGTVIELLGDQLSTVCCTLDAGSEVEITGVTGC